MAYEGMGLELSSSSIFLSRPVTTATTTTSSPEAWRAAVQRAASAVVAAGSRLTAAERTMGGRDLENLFRYMATIASEAATKTREQTIFLIAPVKYPKIYDTPQRYNTVGVNALRTEVSKLLTAIADSDTAARQQAAAAEAARQTQLAQQAEAARVAEVNRLAALQTEAARQAELARQAGQATNPPPVTFSQPEVECTDGYVRDATGLCVPGAAPPTIPSGGAIGPDGYPIQASWAPSISPTPGSTPGSATSIATASSGSLLGVSYKWWGLGAAGLVVGALVLRGKSVTPNTRRRRRRRS